MSSILPFARCFATTFSNQLVHQADIGWEGSFDSRLEAREDVVWSFQDQTTFFDAGDDFLAFLEAQLPAQDRRNDQPTLTTDFDVAS